MGNKIFGIVVFVLILTVTNMVSESAIIAYEQVPVHSPPNSIVAAGTTSGHAVSVERADTFLAVVIQNDNNDKSTRVGPRAWGKLIKAGILCVFLLGGGAVWLFNKLKPQ